MLGNFKYRYITVSNAYEPLPDILLKEGDVNGRGLKIQFSDSGSNRSYRVCSRPRMPSS